MFNLKTFLFRAALLACSVIYAGQAVAQQQVGSVFVIRMENHNFTQPVGDPTAPQQILGNPAAPYINSLITPGNANATYVSYASAYHNVLSTVSGSNPDIHPSEPNYIWQEGGSNFGVTNDNDPYGTGGSVATITANNGGATPEHLCQLLQIAGISWRSYQEDTNLLTTTGVNINTNTSGTLSNNVASPSQYTVPLSSFSGTSASYTNPYNGSHQYNFACRSARLREMRRRFIRLVARASSKRSPCRIRPLPRILTISSSR